MQMKICLRLSITFLILAGFILCNYDFCVAQQSSADTEQIATLSQEVKKLQSQVAELKANDKSNSKRNILISTSSLAFLFGGFCALWAQNTKRNAWLWFFAGLIFTGVAVLVLLYKNSETS
jgi:hypothetical protein